MRALQRVGHTLTFPAFATHVPATLTDYSLPNLVAILGFWTLTTPPHAPIPFLNISDTDPAGEGGLLGLAFHPNYSGPLGTIGRGKFYVYVTVDNGGDTSLGVTSPFSSHIREYTVMGTRPYRLMSPTYRQRERFCSLCSRSRITTLGGSDSTLP